MYSIFQNLLRIKDEIIDGFFGSLIKKFPELEAPLNILKDLIKFLTTPFKIFSPSESITKAWGILSDSAKLAYESFQGIKEFFAGDNSIPAPKGGEFDLLGTISAELRNFSPLSIFKDSGGGAKEVIQNNDININITGNNDPIATGDAAAATLQRSINSASAQLSRDE